MREKYLRNEHGQALIFITLAFVVLGMFIGLAVDGGRAYLMHDRLRKIVDASSLAGAKAMANVPEGGDLLTAVQNAACESAMINGLNQGDCFTDKLTVNIGDVPNPPDPGWPTQQGVIVRGTDTGRTFFMALGALIGCTTCKEINVAATGQAAPDTLADIVLVLDDSGTMSCSGSFSPTECAIEGAKAGANNLIDKVFQDGTSNAMIAFVPFRGCYNLTKTTDRYLPQVIVDAYRAQKVPEAEIDRRGCIRSDEMVSLTKANNKDALKDKITARVGSPGFPGTNICLAMIEGQKKLFAPEAREIARKIMIILTDGSQNYSDFSDGGPLIIEKGEVVNAGIPNLGNPTPSPYPTTRYVPGSGDAGNDSSPFSCKSSVSAEPGWVGFRWGNGGTNFNNAISQLDTKANTLATSLKQTQNVEIYVLRYTRSKNGDVLTTGDPPGSCNPSLVGDTAGVQRGGKDGVYDDENASNDIRDRNFARCLASNKPMNDPPQTTSTPHYFFAATAIQIQDAFDAIAKDILRRRRLVG